MKFNGPGPEIINGRLAMIGILAAAVNESAHAETVVQQVPHVPVRIVALCLLVTYSSLIPILKGAKSEAFGERNEKCQCSWLFSMSMAAALTYRCCIRMGDYISHTFVVACRDIHTPSRAHQCKGCHAWVCNITAAGKQIRCSILLTVLGNKIHS